MVPQFFSKLQRQIRRKKLKHRGLKFLDFEFEQLNKKKASDKSGDLIKVFSFSKTYAQRTNKEYLDDVDRAKKDNCSNEGIKGPAVLSEFMKIPKINY